MTAVSKVRSVVRSMDPIPERMSTAHVAMLAAKTGCSMEYVRGILNGEGIRTGTDIRHMGAKAEKKVRGR